MNWARPIFALAVGYALAGCATDQPDYHVLKLDQTYNNLIVNPHEWALQQFSDGPVAGTNVSDYARIVLAHGLKQAVADLGSDGTQELLLREDCPARVWEVLVFSPIKGGYRYIGHFPASATVLNEKQPSCLVYEACGGQYGYIKTYRHDGQRFVGTCLQDIVSGDGAPEENNRKLDDLFPGDRVMKWTKTLNHTSDDIVAGRAESSR